MKKLGLLAAVCVFVAGNGFALTPEQALQKAVEKEVVKQQVVFNPHLTAEQVTQIPAMLTKTKEYVHQYFNRTWVNEGEVVMNLYYHFSGISYLQEHSKNWPVELEAYEEEQILQEVDHALKYALVKTMPKQYTSQLKYNQKDFGPVTNWKLFHALCQGYMDEIYKVLSEDLATGKEAVLHEVFINILI